MTVIAGTVLFGWGSGGNITAVTYVWAFLYVAVLSFETVYVKHVFNTCEMGTWTRVYYNNVIALCMCPSFLLVGQEYQSLYQGWLGLNDTSFASTGRTLLWVGMSCFVGLAISYFGFGFRSVVTATTFTVLGVLNKIGTLLISALMWSPDQSVLRVAGLLMCLGGGAFYQQAPRREACTEEHATTEHETVALVEDPDCIDEQSNTERETEAAVKTTDDEHTADEQLNTMLEGGEAIGCRPVLEAS